MAYLAVICFILFLVFLTLFLCSTSKEMAKVSAICGCLFLIGTVVFNTLSDFRKDRKDTYATVVITNSENRVRFTDTETNTTYYIDIIKETK